MPRTSLIILLSLTLAACQSPSGSSAQNGADNAATGTEQAAGTNTDIPEKPSFPEWRDALREEALAAGVSAETFDSAFASVRVNPEIIAKDRDQSEFTKPVWSYLDSAVSPERVANGRLMQTQHRAQLDSAAKQYGVPDKIILAIWGLESAYGANTGGYNVIESLATLAYDGRRPDVFREQLIDALLILEAGDIDPLSMRGSWAGAMGQTQFMPSAFKKYAVDGDNDGRRDIWGDTADVFDSTANYLVGYGWTPGEAWGAEVKLPRDFPWEQAEIDIKKPVMEWRKLGVALANGGELPATSSMASVIAPAGHRGPAFIVFDNFHTILRYNYSSAYALAVGHLSDRIAGGPPLVATWPRDDVPLTKDERVELQELLAGMGYDPGGVDGVVGPKTRTALRQYQRSIGQVPDGYPTSQLLQQLKESAPS
ncbi:MAG TPA: lytic murein transglycosylase [Dongiaceae bacterium]